MMKLKNIIPVISIGLVFVLSSLFFALRNNNDFLKFAVSANLNDLSLESKMISTGIEKVLDEHCQSIEILASDSALINLFDTKSSKEINNCRELINRTFDQNKNEIDAIAVVSATGKQIYGFPEKSLPENLTLINNIIKPRKDGR